MAIDFYCASGSPYVWRVWLALEHKGLPYRAHLLSFSAGDLKKPEYLALNPRAKVPAIVDDGMSLYESAAIVEYLDDAYPTSGKPLFPADARGRATARRLIREGDEYFARALEDLVDRVLFTAPESWDAAAIGKARDAFVGETGHFAALLNGDFFVGPPGAVDYTLYPLIALALRIEMRKPDLAIRAAIGPAMAAWMKRVEALPFYERTYPPHWRARP